MRADRNNPALLAADQAQLAADQARLKNPLNPILMALAVAER